MKRKGWFSLVPLLYASSLAFAGPDEAFQKLREGNLRFSRGESTHENQDLARVRDLQGGQSPHTVVLACSDSRVSPEILFDQGLGEIVVIRNAGPVLGSSAIASVEEGIQQGAQQVVVLGHLGCATLRAALDQPERTSTGSTHTDALYAEIRRNLRGTDPSKAARTQTDAVADQLYDRSALVRAKIEKGELRIRRGIYDLGTGLVGF